MRIVLLGAPGAGKGTQAKLMKERFRVPHISTGDLLRAAVAEGSELGRAAQRYMGRGELVPDSLVIDMLDQRLQNEPGNPGFVLDGFPRTVPQAGALDAMLAERGAGIDHVVSLTVPRADLVRRLSGRRTCRKCGAMYHVELDPPRHADICDRCGGTLYQRDDDREETIHARLDVYDRATAPLVDYYRTRGLLRDVDGVGSPAQVLDRVLAQVEQRRQA